MTKQAELKKQAYASALKSRALSILIYLIDRSNQDLTCFPAIPTMAEQLHISVSTVKRALKELVEDGYIQKEARSRANNRGQSSNLYTLMILEQAPIPDSDNPLDHENNIDVPTENTAAATTVTHISFATLQAEQQEQTSPDTAPEPYNHARITKLQKPFCKAPRTPVHVAPFTITLLHPLLKQAKEKAGQLLPCNSSFYRWTGVGFNLQPP
ncbi:MAG: helix-turn-helix domain-containing protein [Christensenellaceae bacterium]